MKAGSSPMEVVRSAPVAHEIRPEELVRGLRQADPKTAAQTWDRYAPMVRRVLRRTLGPQAEVEDCVQDVFVALFEKIGRLQNPASLESYVYGIALNTARSELRRRKRWRLWTRAASPEPAEPRDASLPDSREAVTALYAILDGLSTELRLPFVLRYFEGLELTEVARSLGYSLATAKRRLHKARSHLFTRAARDPRLAAYVTDPTGLSGDG